MEYLLLGITAVAVAVQNIFKKRYNKKSAGGTFFFSGLISLTAMLFFIVINRDWSYRAELLLPSAGFALCYAAATVFGVLAIRYGSLAKTGLITSCSLLLPSFFGIIVFKEAVTPTLVIGTLFLVAALVMINYRKEEGEKKKDSLRWWIFVILSFIGNGGCSIVQNAERRIYGDEGKNMFMIVALFMVVAIMMICTLCMREERTLILNTLKYGWHWSILSGLANGLTNYLVLLLTPLINASVMFPVISGGGLVVVFLYSVFVEKEKFTLLQKIGFLIGIASIVLLNL